MAVRLTQKQNFDSTAGRDFVALEAGGNDPGLIEDQKVSRVQIVYQVRKAAVLDVATVPGDNQQTGGVPWLDGGLRDQLRRKVVVKVSELHRLQRSPGWVSGGVFSG